jgi:hypothetical protein
MVRRLGEGLVKISGNIRMQRDHFFDRHDAPFVSSQNTDHGLSFLLYGSSDQLFGSCDSAGENRVAPWKAIGVPLVD